MPFSKILVPNTAKIHNLHKPKVNYTIRRIDFDLVQLADLNENMSLVHLDHVEYRFLCHTQIA